MKTCGACHSLRPFADFCSNRARVDGLNIYCRPCSSEKKRQGYQANRAAVLERMRQRYADNPDPVRERVRAYNRRRASPVGDANRINHVRRRFGLSRDEYEALVEEHGNRCAVCGNLETRVSKRSGQPQSLAVDHDHASGSVRGLLCAGCNTALGLLNEDPVRLVALLAYVLGSRNGR